MAHVPQLSGKRALPHISWQRLFAESKETPFALLWYAPCSDIHTRQSVNREWSVMEVISMSVGRICVRQVDVADPDEAVQTAARRMLDRQVGSLVVCNEFRQPVGIITDRDMAIRVVAEGRDPGGTPVSEAMTRDPHCVRENTPIEEALAVMREKPCRRLPVLGTDGSLVGLVSLDDVLALLAAEFRDVSTLLAKEDPSSLGAPT